MSKKANTNKPFTVPKTTLTLMREFVKGVIAGAAHAGDTTEMFEDEWFEWSIRYDINIYRNKVGNIVATVYPIVPNPADPTLRTTDASRWVRLITIK